MELLPFDHPNMLTRYVLEQDFLGGGASMDALNVVIHWGIADLDTSKVDYWAPIS